MFKPSVTVAAVITHKDRFLMVEEMTHDGPRFNQPAGHLELSESPLQACVREVREETAREFTPQHFLGVYLGRFQKQHEDITYVRLAFSGTVGDELAGLSYDTEIIRTLWMTADELRAVPAAHRSPMVMLCINDYLQQRLLPLDAVRTHASVFSITQ